MYAFESGVIGLLLGSFLSVLLERLPSDKQGIMMGRSECPHCHHVLAWHDLLPLASYLMLRGRCRYCRARISFWYPTLEIAMAGVFAGYALQYDVTMLWHGTGLVILFGLVALFFFDVRYQILPDVIVFPLAGIVLLRLIVVRPDMLVNSVATGALLVGLTGSLYAFSRGRWIGLGDIKLAFPIGMLFGYPLAIGVTLIAVWSGAIIGIILMAFGRAKMNTALPFGSFWVASGVLALIWSAPFAILSRIYMPSLR